MLSLVGDAMKMGNWDLAMVKKVRVARGWWRLCWGPGSVEGNQAGNLDSGSLKCVQLGMGGGGGDGSRNRIEWDLS